MLYGVEKSTDLRNPQTVVKKFLSRKELLQWMDQRSGEYTHADPEAAQNWHHTFRSGYELRGRINRKDRIFDNHGSSTYPQGRADNEADYLVRYGTEVRR
ncbi:MAG: hypothetical protein WC683_01790 [bacterium]